MSISSQTSAWLGLRVEAECLIEPESTLIIFYEIHDNPRATAYRAAAEVPAIQEPGELQLGRQPLCARAIRFFC